MQVKKIDNPKTITCLSNYPINVLNKEYLTSLKHVINHQVSMEICN